MAEKKVSPEIVETADQKIAIRRVINPKGEATCGKCGKLIVNVEKNIRCNFCWNCGARVRWK